MKIALISIVIAMATAAVAHPIHSRTSLAGTEHAVVRRGVPGGSISGLHAATNPLTRRDDISDVGDTVCKFIKMEELSQFRKDAIKLWKQIEEELENNEDIKNLSDVLDVFFQSASKTLDAVSKKTMEDVKKELNEQRPGLGNKVDTMIKTTGKELEEALVSLAFQVSGCLQQVLADDSTEA